jgi:peptidoglycan/xylan/chitin deacetylase (PgdA/CDA1 family)
VRPWGRFSLWAAFALGAALAAGYALRHVLSQPVVPALIARDADAPRELSPGLAAHLGRMLHDRLPRDRSASPKLIALTFDDGPYPVETPLLLDVLRDLHVKATFFLIGDDTELFPDLARRIEAAGDEIANHTQTHPAAFEALDTAQVRRELRDGARTLERYVRDPAITTMMRPPHGRFTLATVEAAQSAGYHVVLWNDDPGDWRAAATPEAMAAHVERFATAPEIMLLHSGRLNTIEVLPTLVAHFRAAGFRFVTVGELMGQVPVTIIDHPAKLRV